MEANGRLGSSDVAAVVTGYRLGAREVWGPALLEPLGPALHRTARRLGAIPPSIEEADIEQQLQLEAMEAALTVQLPRD